MLFDATFFKSGSRTKNVYMINLFLEVGTYLNLKKEGLVYFTNSKIFRLYKTSTKTLCYIKKGRPKIRVTRRCD